MGSRTVRGTTQNLVNDLLTGRNLPHPAEVLVDLSASPTNLLQPSYPVDQDLRLKTASVHREYPHAETLRETNELSRPCWPIIEQDLNVSCAM